MKKKLDKASVHNGRANSKGVAYNANHNTLELSRAHQPHIDPDRIHLNRYIQYLDGGAASQYNIDGWTWIRFDENNGVLRSADGEWCMLELWTEDENGEYRRCTMKDYAEDEYIWMSPKEDIQQYFDRIGKDWSCDP